MKYIQTVTGAISPDQIGFTLPHEHIFWNLTIYLPENLKETDDSDPRKRKITPEVLGDLNYRLQQYPDNVIQQDLELAVKELTWFRQGGGNTICDCTVRGIGGDILKVKKAAEKSGVNIIAATGAYVNTALTDEFNSMDKDEMAQLFIHDLMYGFDETDIKPGFIKVGVADISPASDERNLAAAAMAQKATGASILIHQPGTLHKADDIFRVLVDHGADLNRVVMCHCDPLLPDHDYIDYMAKSGAYISFDFFGLECMLGKTFWLPTDRDRVFAILEQIKRGNLNRLLMSHDTVYKSMLRTYGGFGYAHLPYDMVPIMLANGYQQDWIDQITINNPREVFSLDSDKLSVS